MISRILGKISGDINDKYLKKLEPIVEQINKKYEDFDSLSDEEIQNKTEEFKERYQNGESLDEMLPEAFAVVKQACKRLCGQTFEIRWGEYTWDMIPYDVQLVWWIVLHNGRIAEMKTWEGKTLVATMPMYLNAITGKWVHLVTVNDYLAARDSEWMWVLFNWLGLEVWAVYKSVPLAERKKEYAKDITYVENTELGFDYLRDNLAKSFNDRVMLWRPLHYAIVDEVDSILVDEARTPLIISHPSDEPTDKYEYYQRIVQSLEPSEWKKEKPKSFIQKLMDETKEEEDSAEKPIEKDYYIDEKIKTVTLTSQWIQKLENILGVENLYKDLWYDEIHHIENALKAKSVFHKDKDYIVRNNQVNLVDEHTGRVMPGRRLSEWLHQAIEAKEGVPIQREAKTVATITYQNFFKQYEKLSWMTGTALTEAEEFERIYELQTNSIPTNYPVIRVDKKDKVFFSQDAKWDFVMDNIKFYHNIGVPFLIWTSSINTSETLSAKLQENTINHYVLNAKYHEQEANIIKNAWNYGSVVVATNMAWRGTDIKLQEWLNEQLSQSYWKWIKSSLFGDNLRWTSPKNLELIIYSEKEYYYTLEGIKQQLELEDLENKLESSLVYTDESKGIKIQVKKNSSKESKDDEYCKLEIKNIKDNPEEEESRDIHYGLYVLATEKHESRRVDNQLRWRAGRQGDPWVSQFFVALDDELMRKMGWEKIQNMAAMFFSRNDLNKMELTQSQFTSSIERAQRQMEAWHFSTRKHLFEYDSVINRQRQRIYSKRDQILYARSDDETKEEIIKHFWNKFEDFDTFEEIRSFADEVVDQVVDTYTNITPWWINDIIESMSQISWITFDKSYLVKFSSPDDLKEYLKQYLKDHFTEKTKDLDQTKVSDYIKYVYLYVVDNTWVDHIDEMHYLRDKVSLYWYAQLDPLMIYKKESYEKYQKLLFNIKKETLSKVLKTEYTQDTSQQPQEQSKVDLSKLSVAWGGHQQQAGVKNGGWNRMRSVSWNKQSQSVSWNKQAQNVVSADEETSGEGAVKVATSKKTKPNDPCPCGSWKKYKKCCWANK